jgi:hypothetical protein
VSIWKRATSTTSKRFAPELVIVFFFGGVYIFCITVSSQNRTAFWVSVSLFLLPNQIIQERAFLSGQFSKNPDIFSDQSQIVLLEFIPLISGIAEVSVRPVSHCHIPFSPCCFIFQAPPPSHFVTEGNNSTE